MHVVFIFEQNILSDFSTVSFFSKIPKFNDKATIMGYIYKNLYQKYVYNKIK